jgi:putative phage-type endonuclease
MSLELVQGTEEWYAARLGKVTSSRIADMVARTKSGWGASRANYMAELVAERLTGKPTEGFQSAAMRRGKDVEPDAMSAYAFYTDATLATVGFVPHPSIAMAGASPDRLVDDDGLVEVKCPNTATHIDTLLGASIPGEYVKQMQWQMACTGRAWCDWVSFDPRLPELMQLSIHRIVRDQAMIDELEAAARVFLHEVAAKVAALRARFDQAEAA